MRGNHASIAIMDALYIQINLLIFAAVLSVRGLRVMSPMKCGPTLLARSFFPVIISG